MAEIGTHVIACIYHTLLRLKPDNRGIHESEA